MRTLWVGTYPPAGFGTPAGRGEGVYRLTLDPAAGALGEPVRAVETPTPSFVVHRDGVLYAADESQAGGVAAFRVHDEGLRPLGTATSGGAYPCHLLVDGDRLYAAHYGGGELGAIRLAPDGSFAHDEPAVVLAHTGSGLDPERQAGSHAHFVALAPGGHLLVVDLGTDEVRRYARTPAGLTQAGVAATLPPGTGPRHVAFAPGGRRAYVSGELDATVHVLSWDPVTDSATVLQTVSAAPPPVGHVRAGSALPRAQSAPMCPAEGVPARDDDAGRVAAAAAVPSPSHVALDGGDVVLAVRGTGVLTRYATGPDGLLTRRTDRALPGATPRHFAIVDGWTVVAEQEPGAVTVLDRDGAVVSSVAVPSAACVAPGVVEQDRR